MIENYTNPTNLNKSNQTSFGSGADQFMMNPFMSPFPFEQQRQEQQDFTKGLTGAIEGQEKLPAMYDRLSGKYNIPQLRETFTEGQKAYGDVLSTIQNIPETIAATTTESMVTEGQRGAMAQAQYEKLAPVAESLGMTVQQVGNMLTQAEQNLNTEVQYEIAQQKKELSPWEYEYDMMQINQAREMTGWTTSLSAELDRLLANQAAGLSWTNAEAQRANALAQIEKTYESQLKNLRGQYELENEFMGYGDALWDTWSSL